MSDEKSLAVAYNIKRRSKKGEIRHEPKEDDYSPRKERLKQMLMQGGAVKEETVEDYGSLDELFPETDIVDDTPDTEVTPEAKRKERLMGILTNFEMTKK